MSAATGVRVRVGDEVVDGADAGAVAAAVGRANARERIEGLEERLNPGLIDPALVAALLAALPDEARTALAGHALYLGSPELPVRMTSPVTASGFAGMPGLEVVDVQGDSALVRLNLAPDCDLARKQAAAARGALETVGVEVARLEALRRSGGVDQRAVLHELAAARARRFAIAGAWRENAVAVSACAPGDAGAATELEAAKRAQAEFALPGGGLP